MNPPEGRRTRVPFPCRPRARLGYSPPLVVEGVQGQHRSRARAARASCRYRGAVAGAVLAAALLVVGPAEAQSLPQREHATSDARLARPDPRPVVIPAIAHLDEPSAELTGLVERLAARVGAVPPAEAALRFEARHSGRPTESDLEAVAQWRSQVERGIQSLGRMRDAEALEALRESQQFAEGAIDELARRVDRARDVLDACLIYVKALIRQGAMDEAQTVTRRCRLLVPGVQPTANMHDPRTHDVLQAVDEELARSAPGRLHVDSHPRGCAVRLNGMELGSTPAAETSRARTPLSGHEINAGTYLVQVECADRGGGASRGRLYRADVEEAGEVTVRVDVAFDAAVRTDRGLLRVQYADISTGLLPRHRPDALRAARVLGAEELYLVKAAGGELVGIDRIHAESGRVLGQAHVRVGATGALLDRVVAALAAGRRVAIEPDGERPVDPSEPPPPPSDYWPPWERPAAAPAAPGPAAAAAPPDGGAERTGGALRVGGAALAAAGVGGLALTWVAVARMQAAAADVAQVPADLSGYVSRMEAYYDARRWVLPLAAVGSALTTASLPLLLPEDPGVPAWAWGVGGAGLALAGWWALQPLATGELFGFDEDACVDRANDPALNPGARGCSAREPVWTLSGALVLHAAPLVAVPLTYLVRSWLGPGDAAPAVALDLGRHRFALSLGGTL